MSDSNIISVQWKINPNGGTVPTWTYGRWGGKGWSAGQFTPTGGKPKWEIEGINADARQLARPHRRLLRQPKRSV